MVDWPTRGTPGALSAAACASDGEVAGAACGRMRCEGAWPRARAGALAGLRPCALRGRSQGAADAVQHGVAGGAGYEWPRRALAEVERQLNASDNDRVPNRCSYAFAGGQEGQRAIEK